MSIQSSVHSTIDFRVIFLHSERDTSDILVFGDNNRHMKKKLLKFLRFALEHHVPIVRADS